MENKNSNQSHNEEAGKEYDRTERLLKQGFSIIFSIAFAAIAGPQVIDKIKQPKEETNQTDKKEA